MAKELILRTDEKPTFFNKEMLAGILVGSFIPGGSLAWLGGMAVAGLLGGLIGERRMEKEFTEGKKVSGPNVLNSDTLIGGLIGVKLAAIVGAVTMLGTLAAGLAMTATPLVASAAALAVGITAMAVTGIGMLRWGMKIGNQRMSAEYAMAQQQNAAEARAPAQNLELEMAQSNNMVHIKRLEQERQRVAGQQPAL